MSTPRREAPLPERSGGPGGPGEARPHSTIVPSPLALRLGAALVFGSLAGALVPALGWACCGALAALALAIWADGRGLRVDAIGLERSGPKRLSLREPERIVDRISSRVGFELLVELRDSSPPSVRIEPEWRPVRRVPAHGVVEDQFQARGLRRGEATLAAPLVRLARPGGLAVRQFSVGSALSLSVVPNVARVKRYEVLRQRRALHGFGAHAARRAGAGAEFDHLRAYSQGDDLRRVNWKATARRGHPISQVVRQERDQSVLLAVDASHWTGVSAGPLSRLDQAVDAAVFLAHVARRSGDRVGLAVFANDVLAFVPPSAQPGHEQRLLDALASVESRPVHVSYRNLARGLLARRLRRSLVVVFSEPIDEESGLELQRALHILRGRHVPLAVSLADPELKRAAALAPGSADELCRRLAAGELIEQRGERLRRLQKLGVETLDVLPQELATGVVNRYLELKSRGAL